MTYLKAIVVGVATALLATVLLFVGMFVLPAWLSMAFGGSGGIGAVSSGSISVALVLIVGFAVGFFWTIRRRKRRGRSVREHVQHDDRQDSR
jgi:uncharacterized RDD family membrane protein YckC